MRDERTYIYGKRAVAEALTRAPQCVERVLMTPEFQDDELKNLARKGGIAMGKFDARDLPRGVDEEANHQGVLAQVALSRLLRSYEDFVATLAVTPDTALVVLGEIQDPQNVGAIIRCAAAFGISGVLIPKHNQAPITGTVVKVSAGMAFSVPLVSIGNVNNAIRDLKGRGFWVYGLEGEAEKSLTDEKFDAPAVFVLGNEAKGIRMKTMELCDILLTIPMRPECESLNVAASSAVALYAWSAQHPGALQK